MTLGAGYRYLMSSVARLDEAGPHKGLTAYYAAKGTPPGRYLGAGLAGLAGGHGIRTGSEVSEEALWRMLGMLQDPVTGEQLGRAPVSSDAVYIDRNGQVRKAPKTVTGFDLTFSVPKSVSVAWALSDDATKARIHTAHRRAIEQTIAYAERHVFATRTGKAGAISLDVRGIVGAAFDHWDSRAGDPQLHTHVVILNRVQALADDRWRTLDSKTLFRHTVALSELYNGLLQDELTRDLGWGWEAEMRPRATEPIWEVEGVPKGLRDEFSQRSRAIRVSSDEAIERFEASHGRRPTPTEILRIRQEATLETRPEKEVHSVAELTAKWRDRAAAYVGGDGPTWVQSLVAEQPSSLLRACGLDDGMKRDLARVVLGKVADKRATFTRANLLAEAHRQLHAVGFATPRDRIECGEQVATLAADAAVQLTPAEWRLGPADLEFLPVGARLRARNSEVFATQELLDAESRLLVAGRLMDGPGVSSAMAAGVAARPLPGRGHVLSGEQAAAMVSVVTSGRQLDVIVGAAGTGKSTTMAGVRAAWEAAHGAGSVIGLAPSAAAAEVLGDAVGVPTENTAKWLTEQTRNVERRERLDAYAVRLRSAYPSPETAALRARADIELNEYRRWALVPGQLVIVDEASMAATHDLDKIVAAAGAAGAKVLLVGDWAQLSPVQAGGAFKMLVDDRGDAPELRGVHRFTNAWERHASLRLRRGDSSVVAAYLEHGRVESGTRDDVLDRMFAAWCEDLAEGKTSLMLASDSETVAELNERARSRRVWRGEVQPSGVSLADGSRVGVGDVVITRLNRRALVTGRGWVRNGDDWTVTEAQADGSLRVQRADGSTALLPSAYVLEHVELGYATTAYRAQGRTVDTAHAYVTNATVREPLYVMATRGRKANVIYVDTSPQVVTHEPQLVERCELADPLAILMAVVEVNAGETSAHEAAQAERRKYGQPVCEAKALPQPVSDIAPSEVGTHEHYPI